MSQNSNIRSLNEVGQSVWYDNLSMDVLKSGELKQLIDSGVSGLTSNPTIFKKAIADTANYDEKLAAFAGGDVNAEEVCEKLMVDDVAAAADLLRPTYDATGGTDGFASIEVSPFLANDTQATITAGQRLWDALARPNIMIKVPATDEGIPAIEELVSRGINVNVTLIFSVEVYAAVADAYINALEKRAKKGEALDLVASVASFFVSRVDAICEKEAEKLNILATDYKPLVGTIGIANSKLAYSKFKEIFSSDRFAKLTSANASVQRPLWASVGTKNPDFSKLLYVEALAGPDTVNTMPPETLAVVMEGAEISDQLSGDLSDAEEQVAKLATMGIDFKALLTELQIAGVKSFADSYQSLLDSIGEKLSSLAA